MQTNVIFSRLTREYNSTYHKGYWQANAKDGALSQGMMKRLIAYTLQRLSDAGFESVTNSATCIDIDADSLGSDKVTDHTFHVTFYTLQGGEIGLQGIMLSKYGWPTIDHGLHIDG